MGLHILGLQHGSELVSTGYVCGGHRFESWVGHKNFFGLDWMDWIGLDWMDKEIGVFNGISNDP